MAMRKLFHQPWGYSEGFLTVFIFIVLALTVEIITGFKLIVLPGWPYNVQIAVSYIALLILIYFSYKNTPVIKWLSGVPACISAIVFFASLSLAIGLFPQSENPGRNSLTISLSNIQRSWLFLFSTVYLLTCLGFVIIRRFSPLSKRNLGFLSNHLGLWLIIFSASLGSGDHKTFQINLEEGKANQIGCNTEEVCMEFPFSLKLLNFHMDVFPAKAALVEYGSDKIDVRLKNNLFMLEKNVEKKIKDFNIKLERYLPLAVYDTIKGVYASNAIGAAPAALLSVKNSSGKFIAEGWISCGSFESKPVFLGLGKKYFLIMTDPEPKVYISTIEITDNSGKKKTVQIKVNSPYTISGWKLYQTSYDIKMGRYSKISILEAVKDPWLPVVYIGIFLLMAGSAYLFWSGGVRIKE